MANTARNPTTKDPVALFTDLEPDPVRRRAGGGWVGWSLLGAAIVGVTVVALLPAPYVIEKPGPVFDVLGDVTFDGEEVPLITIPMEETFPTSGRLDMLPVNRPGNPDNLPTWFDVATAHLDPSRAVLPVADVYPEGETPEQSAEQGRLDMENSQKEAIAAAMNYLGYEVPSTLTVASVIEGGPSQSILLDGDTIVSVNGVVPPDVTALRELVAENGVSVPADVVIIREGVEQTLRIQPELSGGESPVPVIGIYVGSEYEFPFTVTIQLENVGGPSAGMMFALGIIDKLTEGSLTGGEHIAGTGTISSTGTVGPIGGIVQKMWGAQRAGADWFLAPVANCAEVVGHVPPGLTVYSVETLDEAMIALATIRSDGPRDGIPTCVAS